MTPKNEDFPVNIAIIVCILTLFVLKIVGVIPVSWVVFLAPIWVSLLLGAAFIFIVMVAYVLNNLFRKGDKK